LIPVVLKSASEIDSTHCNRLAPLNYLEGSARYEESCHGAAATNGSGQPLSLTCEQLEALGYRAAIYPLSLLRNITMSPAGRPTIGKRQYVNQYFTSVPGGMISTCATS
jgi:hypothetical protein